MQAMEKTNLLLLQKLEMIFFSPLTSLNKGEEGIKTFLAEKRTDAGDTSNFSHLSCTIVNHGENYTGNLSTGHQMNFFKPSEVTK